MESLAESTTIRYVQATHNNDTTGDTQAPEHGYRAGPQQRKFTTPVEHTCSAASEDTQVTAEAHTTAMAAYPREHGEGHTPLEAEEVLEVAPGQGSSERAQALRAS